MRRIALLAALAAAAIVVVLAPASASAKVVWLCKPGVAHDPCRASLTTTVVRADGSTSIERSRPARRPKVDCFYVYPTVSGQPTVNATKAKDPEVVAVARDQASRFSMVCRPYAPVYRQLTISGISDRNNIPQSAEQLAYNDVVEAWRTYLRKFNHGRGVILVSHSQGSFILRELIRQEIDSKPAVRKRLVSAMLLGGDVFVRQGSDRGGDFDHVPACRRGKQIGCVVAYSTFSQDPPMTSLFGRAPDPAKFEVLCTSPSALDGEGRALRPYLPTERLPGPLGLVQDPPPDLPTPWAATPGLYRDHCESKGGATWLQVDDVGRPGDTRQRVTQSLGPDWGLHLVDVNIAFGNLVTLAKKQTAAYLARRG